MAGKAIRFSSDQRTCYRFGIFGLGSMGAQSLKHQTVQLRQINHFFTQSDHPLLYKLLTSIVTQELQLAFSY